MSTPRQVIHAPGAPKPNGNYSHAIRAKNGTLYLAGWMGDDPETGMIVPGGIEAQTVCLLTTSPFTLPIGKTLTQYSYHNIPFYLANLKDTDCG